MSRKSTQTRQTIFSRILLFLAILGFTQITLAQDDFGFGKGLGGNPQDGVPNTFEQFNQTNQGPSAEFFAKFMVNKGTRNGKLRITCVPDQLSNTHLYSQRTDLPDQEPTQFLIESDQIEVTGKFVPDIAPKPVEKKIGEKLFVTEEFSTEVTWTAPITFKENVDIQSTEIEIRVKGQACNSEGCQFFQDIPVIAKAKFGGEITGGPFRATTFGESNQVEWIGTVSHKSVSPGDKFQVTFTAKVDPDWHIYGMEVPEDINAYSPTLIVFSQTSGLATGETAPSVPAVKENKGETELLTHSGEVSFTTELTVPASVEAGNLVVSGKLGFQTCQDDLCKAPSAADFFFMIAVSGQTVAEEQAIEISESQSKYKAVFEIAQESVTENATKPFKLVEFLQYCGIAFLAGLILNVMPCVLPVIGLKMISFLEQSGESRTRIFALNMAYSLGLIAVFWGLGVLVIVFRMGWGEFMNSITGVIVTSGIVFAFGLSMVGVWEIPIPGFASSESANKMAEKEGLGGAFTKGALTTVLATPCVGPLLIPAMTFAISQTTFLAFVLFTVLGIGMASPFIVLAFVPSAVKMLPKPGPWMETFKQMMGFTMIATVIFLLNAFSRESPNAEYVMSILTMLMSVAVGCWWIGRTSIFAETRDKIRAYGIGTTIIAVGTVFAFTILSPSNHKLDWKDYSDAQLAAYRMEQRPVFIDFTGPACPTCQFNETSALNVAKTKKYFEENEIVALRADIADKVYGEQIEALLKKLGNKTKGIPFYAFFPADGGPPVVKDGVITSKGVIKIFDSLKSTVDSEQVNRVAEKPSTSQP